VIDIVYSPADVSPVWLNRKLRSLVEAKLTNPPYPITESPTRLSRYLDASVIEFIRTEVEDDSVFLSGSRTQAMLPGYVDQRVFLHLRAREAICNSPRSQKERELCTILDQESSDADVKEALLNVRHELDYILVTPMMRPYLDARLSRLRVGEKIYDHDGFSIWWVGGAPEGE